MTAQQKTIQQGTHNRDMKEWLHRDKTELILDSDSEPHDETHEEKGDVTKQPLTVPQQAQQGMIKQG
jgi:hypothetical protein